MPQAQKRKFSVNFGELISFLSMTEAYSRTSLNHIQDCGRHPQPKSTARYPAPRWRSENQRVTRHSSRCHPCKSQGESCGRRSVLTSYPGARARYWRYNFRSRAGVTEDNNNVASQEHSSQACNAQSAPGRYNNVTRVLGPGPNGQRTNCHQHISARLFIRLLRVCTVRLRTRGLLWAGLFL